MDYDVFSVGSLNHILRETRTVPNHLVMQYLPLMQTETDAEEIHFEVINDKPRITPLVSPLEAGKIVDELTSEVKSFHPAYAKDKRRYNPNRPLKRMAGERLGGSMSPMQRQAAIVAATIADQERMLARRWEVMTSEALRTGKVTVVGENYPSRVVDFQRLPAHTKTLAGATRWGQAGVEPLDDLEDWMQEVLENSGVAVDSVTMDVKAWKHFSASAKLEKRLDTQFISNATIITDPQNQGAPTLASSSMSGNGARYKGRIGDVDIWVYNAPYSDDAGVTQKMLPDWTVILAGRDADGTRCFGNILDEAAGFRSMDYYSKSWLENDPAIRFILLQCAPLPAFYRPNGTMCVTVDDGV